MSPFARWLSPFLSLPACIFYTAVTPLCPSRLCRRGFCLFVHAGLHLFSHHRRAFFMLFLRQLGRFDDAGEKFTGVCTLVPAVPRLASVHFSSHFSAGLAVSTMPVGNFPPCARSPLPFLDSPACIFLSISPPAWPSRCCRRGFCLLLHAGLHLSSHLRRAFFSRLSLRFAHLPSAGGDFVSLCTPAYAFPPITGVHFFPGCHSALPISPLSTEILSPFARRPPPFFPSPAGIFLPVSPPPYLFRLSRRRFCLLLHASLHLSSHPRRAFFSRLSLRFAHLPSADRDFVSLCTPASTFLPLSGMQDAPDQPGHLHIISLIKHAAAIPASH